MPPETVLFSYDFSVEYQGIVDRFRSEAGASQQRDRHAARNRRGKPIRVRFDQCGRAETSQDGTGTIPANSCCLDVARMPLDYIVSALLTLLVVVDPVGLAPTFLAVTEGLPSKARRSVALRACLIAATILIGTALIGDWLFVKLGISLSAFRIAGGLLLFSIATEMVFGVRSRHEGETAEQALEEHVRNIAAFPLAIPLMAGPGAITATVLLSGKADGRALVLGALIVVVVVVIGACLAVFLLAQRIGRLLGITGTVVLSRLLGVLLAALAVQYVVDGIRDIFLR
jgi:multiple antibiotic resistance protein